MSKKQRNSREMSHTTLQMVHDYYIGQREVDGYASDTLHSDRVKIGGFMRFVGPDCLVRDLTPEQAERYIKSMRERTAYSVGKSLHNQTDRPLSGHTIANATKSLKAFGKWMSQQGFGNPFSELRLPKDIQHKIIPCLSKEEMDRIDCVLNEDTATGARDKALIWLMADTGIRLSEAIYTTLSDLNLQDQELHILHGKGRQERTVPFGVVTKQVLLRYIHVFRPPPVSDDCIFLALDGYKLTRDAVEQIFRRIKRRAGLTRFHPHLLRHSFAQWYLIGDDEIGISPGDAETLSRIMGHKSFETTKKYTTGIQLQQVKKVYASRSPMDRIGGKQKRRRFIKSLPRLSK